MADVTYLGAAGDYHFSNNTLSFIVDSNPSNPHHIILTVDGQATLTFDPADSISDANLERALKATLTVVGTDVENAKYNDTQIYTVANSTVKVLQASDWTSNSDGTYTYTINSDDLEPCVTMADFHLPSVDDYVAFRQAQRSAVFRIKVNPADATPDPVN